MNIPVRPRRLRQSEAVRNLIQETRTHPSQFIYPLFISEQKSLRKIHPQLSSALTLSMDEALKEAKEAHQLGIKGILLFGVSDKRDSRGSEALRKDSALVRTISEIREACPGLLVATDIALDPYTDHGHDGLFENGKILNDASIEVLSEMSVLHAKAGAQILAPSDMMDGRIGAIRRTLDQSGHEDSLLLSYTAKYASSMYGPFREVLSSEVVGDKKTYQMDPANRREALRELTLDLNEGADMVMVKPASWYLDIISDFKKHSNVPVVAYHVSGECAMIEVGAKAGLFNRERAIQENIISMRRAGADIIVTYFAKELARASI